MPGFVELNTNDQYKHKQADRGKAKQPIPTIFAVDFDGTLCKNRWPEIGPANQPLIDWLIMQKKSGVKLILWTMREGELLDDAMRWCAERGLRFDAVNDNLQEMKDLFGNNPRKVFADCYIDDRNM